MASEALLVIDDDAELAALLTRYVRRCGYLLRWVSGHKYQHRDHDIECNGEFRADKSKHHR
jgi:DNA-binding response OmpR family regulator